MKLAANILAFDFERKSIINTDWAKVFKKGLDLTPKIRDNTVSLSSTIKFPLRKKLRYLANSRQKCAVEDDQFTHGQLCHEHCEQLLIIQGSCVKEVKGPLLIFKCLLNWCHGTPSLHLPTLANVERAKIQERRPSEGKKKTFWWAAKPVHCYKVEFTAKMKKKNTLSWSAIGYQPLSRPYTESAWAERPSFIKFYTVHPTPPHVCLLNILGN